jgi:hypothetical protein
MSEVETLPSLPQLPQLSPPGVIHDDDDSADLFGLTIVVPYIEPDDQ